jgi:hypothetical protein
MKELDDSCVEVACRIHGHLARVIVGAEVLCQSCGCWITAIPDEERRKLELRRARNQRYYKGRQSSAIQTI